MAAQSPNWTDLLGMGVVIAAQLVGFITLGWFADSRLDTGPALLLVGLVLGLAGSVAYAVAQFRQYLQSSSTATTAKSTDHNDVSED